MIVLISILIKVSRCSCVKARASFSRPWSVSFESWPMHQFCNAAACALRHLRWQCSGRSIALDSVQVVYLCEWIGVDSSSTPARSEMHRSTVPVSNVWNWFCWLNPLLCCCCEFLIVILIPVRQLLSMPCINASLAASLLASAGLEDWPGELYRMLRSRIWAATELTSLLRDLLRMLQMVICRRVKVVCNEVLRLIDGFRLGSHARCS